LKKKSFVFFLISQNSQKNELPKNWNKKKISSQPLYNFFIDLRKPSDPTLPGKEQSHEKS